MNKYKMWFFNDYLRGEGGGDPKLSSFSLGMPRLD